MTEQSAKFKETQKPHLLFVGFKRPHFPLRVPEKFFNLYPEQNISAAENEYVPRHFALPSWVRSPEILNYGDMKSFQASWRINSSLPKEVAKRVRRAYYASVSYIDDILGQMLDHLDSLGTRNNTVIVFTADHGVHLGENGIWGKFSNFEVNTRVPLLISVPGYEAGASDSLVELVDLFPTLVEAVGLPNVPICPEHPDGIALCTEGVSLMPLIKNPTHAPWKDRVFWQTRWNNGTRAYLGHSIRNKDFRYSEWLEATHGPPRDWCDILARELFDKKLDPGENNNVVDEPRYDSVIKGLSQQLHEGWRAAVPKQV
jgi:iduronate 2-sulfatase